MCGITGYIGPQNGLDIVMRSLRCLEYRGYDSAGVVFFDKDGLQLVKAVGKLDGLDKKLKKAKSEPNNVAIGHCLHPQTVIQLSNGRTFFIKDMANGDSVLNLNLSQLSMNNNSVAVFKHKSPANLYRVTTAISDFVSTSNHRTLVYEGKKIIAKEIKRLRVGDLLPIPAEIKISNNQPIYFETIGYKRYYSLKAAGFEFLKNKIKNGNKNLVVAGSGVSSSYIDHLMANDRNFREDQLHRLYNYFGEDFNLAVSNHLEPVDTIHGKFINLPTVSSPNLMQFLGYYIGDGYAGKRSFRSKDLDSQVLEFYRKLIKDLFNIDGRIVSQNDTKAYLLECNSFYLCQWLKKNIVFNRHSFVSIIGQLPDEQLSSFIRGLFDAEGCVNGISRQLCICMKDEFLIRSLQLWLLRFGIVASLAIIKPNKTQRRPNFAYKLSISNKQSISFFKERVGFSGVTKKNKLNYLLERVGNRLISFKTYPGNNRLLLTKVKKIESIKSETPDVYDLSVADNENFLANSIFTHNSRWATHGIPSEINAHPHHDCRQEIFVVHNGIVENYRELKSSLEKSGHKFKSQTDTEIVPHLIEEIANKNKNKNFLEVFEMALKQIRGAYAFAVINKKEPNNLYFARLGSPLVVGVGESGHFLASDPAALAGLVKKVIYLKEGQRGVLSLNGFAIGPAKPKLENLNLTPEQAQKGKFPHFMLKEIFEIPEVVRAALMGRLLPEKKIVKLGGLEMIYAKLKKLKRLEIVACGTSYYAGLVGELLFEELVNLPTEVTVASEFRYRKNPLRRNEASLFVSQSGETADTLAALRKVSARRLLTLGLVNVVGSAIARETKAGVYARAGAEIGVASTKAFLSQLTNLVLMALQLSPNKSSKLFGDLILELAAVPQKIELIIKDADKIKKLAEKYLRYKNFLYLGRGYNYPTALEGALKIKELAYVHAEAYAGGEMKHGPLALIDENFPTVVLVTKNSLYEKMISNLEEIKARNGKILAIAAKGDEQIKKLADDVIYVPATLEQLEPMINVISLHLFAYYFGTLKGYDVDKPRNLAKSVTVE